MTIFEVQQLLDDIELAPAVTMISGEDAPRLYMTFDKVYDVPHADYVFRLLRAYYLVSKHRRKIVVMIPGALGRGTFTDRKVILEYLEDRLARVIS